MIGLSNENYFVPVACDGRITAVKIDRANIDLAVDVTRGVFAGETNEKDIDILQWSTGGWKYRPWRYKWRPPFIEAYLLMREGETIGISSLTAPSPQATMVDVAGFGLLPSLRGQGLGREALATIEDVAVATTNAPCLRVMVKYRDDQAHMKIIEICLRRGFRTLGHEASRPAIIHMAKELTRLTPAA